ncbi:palmitoyltransferase [Maudiozyma humilis]|uniref:Palmitoyltransferase n=1 Tax=Maudiozyma humilis TaxID=51915 RepID=A0AAV5S3T0_MAUHU|nr:palmitoyltransferase [Kazachstania humilis]
MTGKHKMSFTSVFPKAFTTILFAWTYYITVTRVTVCPSKFVLVISTLLVAIALYTYFRVVVVGPGSPLDFPDLAIRNMTDVENGTELPPEYLTRKSLTIKHDGRFRVCQTCKFWKPDRCHHCSTCERCILKMDHHCPWFADCIGFLNQKLFIQFLLYTTVYSVWVFTLMSAELSVWFRAGGFEYEFINIPVLQVWIVALVITISMLVFSWFTVRQLVMNQTTNEMYGVRRYRREFEIRHGMPPASDVNVFDLGSASANWRDVMGDSWVEWLLPIKTFKYVRSRNTRDEKGLYFDVSQSPQSQGLLQDADLQDRLVRRLTPRSSLDTDLHHV